MGRFLLVGALLGRRLGTSWGVLKACWAVLRPSQALGSNISVSPGSLGPSRRLLGPLLDRLEPSWAPKRDLAGTLPRPCRDLAGFFFRPGTPMTRPARANQKYC
eukprot:9486136-Pyramimonas_sp.AAC.4